MFHFLQQARHWRMKRELNRLHIELAGRFDYLRRASRCRTQNEFNRLHIELENILTPLELAGIAKLAKDLHEVPSPADCGWRESKNGNRSCLSLPKAMSVARSLGM